MKKLHLLFTIWMFIILSCADKSDIEVKAGKSDPVFYLIEWDPWKKAIGSDSPSFIIYGNGTVIYSKVLDNRLICKTVLWSKNEIKKFFNNFIYEKNLMALKERYRLTYWTDQIENEFGFVYKEHLIKTRIYGDIMEDTLENDRIPNGLKELFTYIKNYGASDF